MYTFIDFGSQITMRRGSLVPQKNGARYTNLVSGLTMTLKLDYYSLLLNFYPKKCKLGYLIRYLYYIEYIYFSCEEVSMHGIGTPNVP
jgi:hypothetical protein